MPILPVIEVDEEAPTLIPDFLLCDELREFSTTNYLLNNFLEYAKAKVLDQALPNFMDGLLPSQRKHLLAMQDIGALPGRKTQKSTAIVSQQTSAYHPVGNTYDVLVNMSNVHTTPAMICKPEGNWGEIEGTEAAAERYTENLMSKFGHAIFFDDLPGTRTKPESIYHNIVPCQQTYNEQLLEEMFLPARVPMLLVNGSTGIAVGIAQSFQPLAIRPVIDATIARLHGNPIKWSSLKLAYPTNPVIISTPDETREAFKSGRGSIKTCCNIKPIYTKTNRVKELHITSLTKNLYLNSILDAFNEWRSKTGKDFIFSECRNETDTEQILIVLKVKKAQWFGKAVLPEIIRHVYAKLGLVTSNTVNMTALRGCYPIDYNVESLIDAWCEERNEIIKRLAIRKKEQLEKERYRLDVIMFAKRYTDSITTAIKSFSEDDRVVAHLITCIAHANDAHKLNDLQLTEHPTFLELIYGLNFRQISKKSEEQLLLAVKRILEEIGTQSDLINSQTARAAHIEADLLSIRKRLLREFSVKDIQNKYDSFLSDTLKRRPSQRHTLRELAERK